LVLILHGEEETLAVGAALYPLLPPRCLVFLYGELGAGKTTLVRGLLRAAGYHQTVKSPTYSLVEEYQVAGRRLLHFDLYRIKDPEELAWMGMDDYLQQDAQSFIEWPQRGEGHLPVADFTIHLSHQDGCRRLECAARDPVLQNSMHLNWKNKDILL
jgi:tRNA threonylcarbamoyladenosine biosynthesis protein TsaE